jgi:hypothetical protein
MAASVAAEFLEKWPFAIVHLQVRLNGFGALKAAAMSADDIVTLGLAGLTNCDSTRIPSILALQNRLMAVRLAGQRLVAFCPQRDFRHVPESWDRRGSLQAMAFAVDGRLIAKLERSSR